MIEFTLRVKVLTENDVGDMQDLLGRMLEDGRMTLATENFEPDVTDARLHGSRAGRRYPSMLRMLGGCQPVRFREQPRIIKSIDT